MTQGWSRIMQLATKSMHQYVGVMGLPMVMIARLGPEELLPLPKVLVGIKKEKAFISEGL